MKTLLRQKNVLFKNESWVKIDIRYYINCNGEVKYGGKQKCIFKK